MPTAAENQVTTPVDEAEADAEAERLFAEAAAEREGTQVDGPAAQSEAAAAPKPDDGQPGGDTTAGEGSGAAASQGQSGGGEGSAAAAAGSGEGDVWANVPSEAKAAYDAAVEQAKQAEHRFKSREGREAALQRQIAELKRQGGQEQDQRKPLKELLSKETVTTLGDDYPDLKPVLEALSAGLERIDGVEQQVGEAKSTAVAAATAPELRALEAAVPNWQELIGQDKERFLSWVDDQPRAVRDTVQANWDQITNATEAAKVFQSFADHIGQAKPEEGQGGGSSKRDRQQSSARAAKVTAPAAAAGESDDAEVAWKEASAKKDRARGLRT